MLRDFHVPHGHPDFRMPQDLLQDRHIGARQDRPGSERVAEIVEIDGAPQTQFLANVVMGFSDGPEMGTWFSGARKDPVVVWMALPVRLEKFENFLTHRQSTFGVLGFSTHDQDGTVKEVEVRIRHSKDFIWPHSLPEHDYRDALEGLGGKRQIVELLYERQDVDVWNLLRERLHFPGG